MARLQSYGRGLLAFGAALASTLLCCATYDGKLPAEAALSSSGSAATAAGLAGAGQTTEGGGSGAAGAGPGGSAGTSTLPSAGSPSVAGSAGSDVSSGGASGGGPATGGGSGTAGAANAGAAGNGEPVQQQLLSEGKPVTADSEEAGHLAVLGNDGSASTRWCAANSATGHYWQVDLGQPYSVEKLVIHWEKAALYRFKVEGSSDAQSWALVLDETQTDNANADQTYTLEHVATARYVRVTATGLPNSTTWASFFEFAVLGH